MSWLVELGKRVAVAILVAVVIVAGAAAVPAVTSNDSSTGSLSLPEYRPGALAASPTPAEGVIEPNTSAAKRSGLVIIDEGHGNRFDRSTIAPMVEALTDSGYTVRFHGSGSEDLGQALSIADAYVVIDPDTEFTDDEMAEVREFTRGGGRLLLVGEPNRKSISGGFFGVTVRTQESSLTSLASKYGMSIDTNYLYNLETNDGNYRYVVARPTKASGYDDVGQVTMYTAATVQSRHGDVLLRTVPNTRKAESDVEGRHAVAVRHRNVMLLGDTTFLTEGRHNVADNEVFIAHVIEFLITGEKTTTEETDEEPTEEETDTGSDTSDEGGNGGETPTGNQTVTPSPTTPIADAVHAAAVREAAG